MSTDIVFLDNLQLTTNVGRDCWGRIRPQTVLISVYLHLHPSFLAPFGESDDLNGSVHYGHLAKSINQLVDKKNQSSEPFGDVRSLIDAVTKVAFELAGGAAAEVRVVVDVPKMVLLVDGFTFDVTTPVGLSSSDMPCKVSVVNVVLAALIGVNPPEREAKQRLITNISFTESSTPHPHVDYASILQKITKDIEASSYLTVEKLVTEILRTACLANDAIQLVTVRAQKTHALPFVRSCGVEITRSRDTFVSSQEYFHAL